MRRPSPRACVSSVGCFTRPLPSRIARKGWKPSSKSASPVFNTDKAGSSALRHLAAGEVLEDADQAGMVPGLAAERGGGVEQLLHGRGVGQRQVQRTGALQRQV